MDLNEFKTLWKSHTDHQIKVKRIDIVAIKKVVKGKASHALSQLCNSILLDIIFLVSFLAIGIVSMLLTEHQMIDVIVITSGIVFVPFFGFFIKEYFFLKKIELQTESLRQVLEKVIISLSKYVKWYFRAVIVLTIAVVPIVIALVFYNADKTFSNPILELAKADPQLYAVIYSVVLVSVLIGNYFFTKWYLQKLYGNYISTLKNCLDELNETIQYN
ncbi:MAG: hypothetical protein ACPG19_05995 [Saprospiraceae bacterium]